MAKWKTGLLEGIINPERLRVEEYQKKQQSINPYQQMMATKYLEQNPDADFTGIPGYEAVQERYNQSLISQGGPLFKAKKDEKGKTTGYSPKEGGKEKLDSEKATDPIMAGRTGFEPITAQKRKDQVFGKIQEKRKAGMPISDAEAKYEQKYLGIKTTKKGPDTPQDIVRVRKIAKDMARSAMIEEVGEEGAAGYEPTEEDIQMQMTEATKFLYPNAEIEKNPEKVKYDIELPKNITKQSQAVEYLIKQGMNEEEAKQWITERL